MPVVFQSMELDDEDQAEMAVPCETVPNKKLLPQYPWGLRITLTEKEMAKLKLDPSAAVIDGMIHLFAMARITSVSCDKRADGSENHRCELQIEQLALESEDEENEEAEAEAPKPRAKLRAVYGK